MSKAFLQIKIPGTSTVISCEGWPATIIFIIIMYACAMAFALGLAGVLVVLTSLFPPTLA